LVILPALWVAQQINFEDPTNLMIARISFGIVSVLEAIVLLYIRHQISAAKDQTKINVPKGSKFGQPSPTPGETETVTIQEYDTKELDRLLQQLVLRVSVMLFIHWKWAITVPLVLQLVTVGFSLWKEKLVQFHGLGKRGTGFSRPFPPPPNPFDILTTMSEANQTGEDKQGDWKSFFGFSGQVKATGQSDKTEKDKGDSKEKERHQKVKATKAEANLDKEEEKRDPEEKATKGDSKEVESHQKVKETENEADSRAAGQADQKGGQRGSKLHSNENKKKKTE